MGLYLPKETTDKEHFDFAMKAVIWELVDFKHKFILERIDEIIEESILTYPQGDI